MQDAADGLVGGYVHADPLTASAPEAAGLDPSVDFLPVAPAAHHQCGGIVTDLNGAPAGNDNTADFTEQTAVLIAPSATIRRPCSP